MESPAHTPTVANNSGRLKYAEPRDLPSYPSPGLRADGAAASAAASLGWANQKPVELWKPDKTASASAAASLGWSNQKPIETWKPDKTSSASAAAALAKDYKMAPPWEPESNSAPARAALLAVGSSKQTPPTPKKREDGWGNSAATQAFNTDRTNSLRRQEATTPLAPAQGERSMAAAKGAMSGNNTPRREESNTSQTAGQGEKSLAAAKGAMSGTRRRALSSPSSPPAKESYPGESMAASNALSGATLAHRASTKSKPIAEGAGAVSITTMTRNMFTSHPPVKIEVDEKENNERIHQSAVEMAKKMYSNQQKNALAKGTEAESTVDQPGRYVNLQDAAFKQAQERLAKLHDEHQKDREYKDYYGNPQPPRRRFSLSTRLRRRSSSDGEVEDRQQSAKIRQQMSMFSDSLTQVDTKKRQTDRDALLAIAQRNVKARLQGMDQKVYEDTGKVNPTMMSEWEAKAHAAAQVKHESRTENKGKVDIGGGKFMDPHDVNIIAAKRVQPMLDDLNERAEAQRERQAAAKMEEEDRKAELERKKARDLEVKGIYKQLKEQEKQDEKVKRQQEKDEEKTVKAEQKRLAREEKIKSKPETTTTTGNNETISDGERFYDTQESVDKVAVDTHTSRDPVSADPVTAAIDAEVRNSENEHRQTTDTETSPTSPTSKVKGWIKNRFSRGKSISEPEKQPEKRRSFVGGAALRGPEANDSTTSLENRVENRPSSMRDVALAGHLAGVSGQTYESTDVSSVRDSRGVSPISTPDNERPRSVGSDEDVTITAPRPITDPAVRTSSSPTRDSRFREILDGVE
ncbi:hypothetical protein G7046_g6540 [Stylonectria norvegica]|nr:hypothetical protein G7046_g6540 [Stylonectria norvegica]